jgi:hypothetical protein
MYYPHALYSLDERPRVRALAGIRAERLIHAFSVLDRRHLQRPIPAEGLLVPEFGRDKSHALSALDAAGLLVLEMANIAEQSAGETREPGHWMSRVGRLGQLASVHRRGAPRLARGLNAPHESQARLAYLEGVEAVLSGTNGRIHFLEACRLNPWIAEPHLWLAAEERPGSAARLERAAEARRLLLGWGTAWDKRLSWTAWLELIARISSPGTPLGDLAPLFLSARPAPEDGLEASPRAPSAQPS